MFPVAYQEMQALGLSTGEADMNFELQSLDREKCPINGKEILPFFFFFAIARHINRNAFQNKNM